MQQRHGFLFWAMTMGQAGLEMCPRIYAFYGWMCTQLIRAFTSSSSKTNNKNNKCSYIKPQTNDDYDDDDDNIRKRERIFFQTSANRCRAAMEDK